LLIKKEKSIEVFLHATLKENTAKPHTFNDKTPSFLSFEQQTLRIFGNKIIFPLADKLYYATFKQSLIGINTWCHLSMTWSHANGVKVSWHLFCTTISISIKETQLKGQVYQPQFLSSQCVHWFANYDFYAQNTDDKNTSFCIKHSMHMVTFKLHPAFLGMQSIKRY